MRSLWRTLPRLALPAAMGLGLAYLGTGFFPRPEPTLRPPEELRAHGQGLDEDSPVRAIFERNVLRLKSPPFTLPGSPLTPPVPPDAAEAAFTRATASQAGGQSQATFATPEPVLAPKGGAGNRAPAALSGGPAALGVAVPQVNGQTGGQTSGQSNGQPASQTNSQANGQAKGQNPQRLGRSGY